MIPKLFAFDLDGTLLDSGKRISPANAAAIREIRGSGAAVALASGRLGSGVRRYVPELGIDPALVILNGAEVYTRSGENAEPIYNAPLDPAHAAFLTGYGAGRPVAVNFYYEDRLYTVKNGINAEWTGLYHRQTGVCYNYIGSFAEMGGVAPAKIIFVGAPSYIDELETHFRGLWSDSEVYVCRSWDHYLEFMSPMATKGLGLTELCNALGIDMADAAAYGDAENDIPMLSAAGHGTAMRNSHPKVLAAAKRVTELTNDEDWVAREWQRFINS